MIFLSYRQSDTRLLIGRIADSLGARFGIDSVFYDIDSISPGTDIRKHIQNCLSRSKVLVAVIGPAWLDSTTGNDRKLCEEIDWVRVEISTALQMGLPVIPVLVGDAEMPLESKLPESMKALAFLRAEKLDVHHDFKVHIERLISTLRNILGDESANQQWTPEGAARASELARLIDEGERLLSASLGELQTAYFFWTSEAQLLLNQDWSVALKINVPDEKWVSRHREPQTLTEFKQLISKALGMIRAINRGAKSPYTKR